MSDHADTIRQAREAITATDQALTVFEVLLAENQRLAAERDGAEKAGRAEAERFLAQLDEVRAENQRLREFIQAVADCEYYSAALRENAREALAGDAE